MTARRVITRRRFSRRIAEVRDTKYGEILTYIRDGDVTPDARLVITGRRFSRRIAIVCDTDLANIRTYTFHEDIEIPNFKRLWAEAVEALEAVGVPARKMLDEPGGVAALQEHVLYKLNYDHDSHPGLAAQLLKILYDYDEFRPILYDYDEFRPSGKSGRSAGWFAGYTLGRLVTLWRAYTIDDAQRAAAAKAPRRADPMRAAILKALAPFKRKGDDFKTVMESWQQDRIGSLRLTAQSDDRYLVEDEDGTTPGKEYTWQSLRTMYSQSDKADPEIQD